MKNRTDGTHGTAGTRSRGHGHLLVLWVLCVPYVPFLAQAGGTATPDLTTGLVAHYPFDKDASDASGKGHDATNHGATPVPGGRIGGALSFDGTSTFVSVPAGVTEGLTRFTFALWLKTSQSASAARSAYWQNPALMGVDTAGYASRDFALMLENGKTAYYHGLDGEGDVSFFTASAVNDSQWHHIAVTNDGSYVTLFVDGRPVRGDLFLDRPKERPLVTQFQSAAGHPLCGSRPYIGACHDAEGHRARSFIQGLIDDVRIWKRALTAREVAALWTQVTGQAIPPDPLWDTR